MHSVLCKMKGCISDRHAFIRTVPYGSIGKTTAVSTESKISILTRTFLAYVYLSAALRIGDANHSVPWHLTCFDVIFAFFQEEIWMLFFLFICILGARDPI